MNKKRLLVLILLLIAFAFGIYSIMPKSQTSAEKIQVTTSFYPLAEFATRIGGEKATVLNVVPAGMEPHDFDPTPQNLVRINKSLIFIYNGGGFEPWIERTLSQMQTDVLSVNTSAGVELMHMDDQEHGSEGTFDPHIWLDPTLAQIQAENILQAYLKKDGAHSAYYKENAASLKNDLQQLDQEFKNRLSNCAKNTIITSHSAFNYIGKRYGFEIISVAGLNPDQEPSAQELAKLVDLVKEKQIEYVFFETLASPKLAETLAKEAGAKTLSLNPLEGLTEDELAQNEDYFTIQRENIINLSTALQCKPINQ